MKYYVTSIPLSKIKEEAELSSDSISFAKKMDKEKWITFGNTYRADNCDNLVNDIIEAGMVCSEIYIYLMTKSYHNKNMPKVITNFKSFNNRGILSQKELGLISEDDLIELLIPEETRIVDFTGAKLIVSKLLKNNFKNNPVISYEI